MNRVARLPLVVGCVGVVGTVGVGLAGSCAETGSGTASGVLVVARPVMAMPTLADPTPRDFPGIHNAVAYHEGFVSGSAPEGDVGFDTLAGMGVKAIISVDGAVPEVEKAEARGIRYIHLPIGYNGFDDERRRQLTRATRDAMRDGPVYIHCHHGKHRSAGAAAAIAASLGWMDADEGVARMKVSGTAANYTGLYACAMEAAAMSEQEVDAVPAQFASVWTPTDFVAGMVELDEVVEHLKAIEKAGWKVPGDHPDLVPAAEAGRLVDLYRMMAADAVTAKHPAEFAAWLTTSREEAQAMEDALAGVGEVEDASLGEKAGDLSARFKRINASCKACHAKYRD